MLRLLYRCGLLLVASVALASSQSEAPILVFAVLQYPPPAPEGQVALDPILAMQGGRLVAASLAEIDKNPTSGWGRLVSSGTRLHLIHGGAYLGDVVVTKTTPCDFATGELKARIPGGRDGMALAMNSPVMPRRQSQRRVLTTKEHEEVLSLVLAQFRESGANQEELSNVRIMQAAATSLGQGSPSWFFVSAAVVTDDMPGRNLFVVAQRKASGLSSSLIWYQNPEREAALQMLALVDHLDLDRDGLDEIVLERSFYEGSLYEVYRLHEGAWQKILETEYRYCGG